MSYFDSNMRKRSQSSATTLTQTDPDQITRSLLQSAVMPSRSPGLRVTRFVVFCTLGNFLKPLAAINLPKSPTFLGNFCKGFKIYHFSGEIIFGQLL